MQNIDRGFAGMKKEFKKNGVLYLIVLPVIIYYFIFHYMPLYGLLMAFQDFSPRRGIMGSEWVGLTHFINFFKSAIFICKIFLHRKALVGTRNCNFDNFD